MNLYPEVKINNNLIENEVCNITYSGFLFKNNSESVSIVYGFGEQWDNTTHLEMEKTEEGFKAEFKVLNFNKLNFCFKNSNNEWDNNNYQNYTAPISMKAFEPAFIINENVVNNILDNIFEYDISTIKTTSTKNITIENTISQENIHVETNTTETIENSIVESSIVTNESEYLVENVASITEEKSAIEAFEVSVENTEPIDIEESIVNITEENSLNNDINELFNELYETDTTENTQVVETTTEKTTVTEFNMDSLIDEILEPITKSDIFDNKSFIITSESPIGDFDFSDKVEDLEEDIKVDNIIDNLITELTENAVSTTETVKEYDFIGEEENNSFAENIEQETNLEISDDFSSQIIKDLQNTSSENIQEISSEEISEEQPIENSITNETSIEDVTATFFEDILEDSLLPELDNVTESETTNFETEEIEGTQTTALVEVEDFDNYLVSPRSLGKFYKFKKKVKLAFYKVLALPKMLLKFGKQHG